MQGSQRNMDRRYCRQIEDEIHTGQTDRAYDFVKLLFQNRTKSSRVENKERELVIAAEDIRNFIINRHLSIKIRKLFV